MWARVLILHGKSEVKGKNLAMAFNMLRHLRKPAPLVFNRMIATSAARLAKNPEAPPMMVYPEDREHHYPRIGNRDIVSFGLTGVADYADIRHVPMPAIRFKENTEEIMALREKEKDDWSQLTIDEKKELYRASFCSTFAEFTHPTGEWKSTMASFLGITTITLMYMAYLQDQVYLPLISNTEENHTKNIQLAIAERAGPIKGISSMYDYEKRQWK